MSLRSYRLASYTFLSMSPGQDLYFLKINPIWLITTYHAGQELYNYVSIHG